MSQSKQKRPEKSEEQKSKLSAILRKNLQRRKAVGKDSKDQKDS